MDHYSGSRKQKSVVICDDDLGILNMLEMIIESTGTDVVKESDSSKLMDKVLEVKPALLIIDLWMPNMAGDVIVQELRSQKEFDDTYILCISASMNGREIAIEAGADQFLAKPFDITDILSVVNQVITLPN